MDTPCETWTLDTDRASNPTAADDGSLYELHIDAIPNECIQEHVWMEGESRVRVVAAWSPLSGLEELTTCLYAYPGIGDNETEVIGDAIDMLHDDEPQFHAMRAEIVAGRNPWVAYAVEAGRLTSESKIGAEEIDYIVRTRVVEIDPALVRLGDGERVELGALLWDLLYRRETADPRVDLAAAVAGGTRQRR